MKWRYESSAERSVFRKLSFTNQTSAKQTHLKYSTDHHHFSNVYLLVANAVGVSSVERYQVF